MSSELNAAAENLKAAHAHALGALDAALSAIEGSAESARKRARAEHDKAVTKARIIASQHVAQHSIAARDLSSELLENFAGALRIADTVEVGTLSLPGAERGVNADVTVPCVLPLLGRANLVVALPGDSGRDLARHVVADALEYSAPGQVEVVGYDPQLLGVLSPFAGVKDAAPSALTIINKPSDFAALADRLASDVQRVNDLLRGGEHDLLDHRAAEGASTERLRLVVMVGTPGELPEEQARQLLALSKAGPRAGISLLWLVEPDAEVPEWWAQADWDGLGEFLEVQGTRNVWRRHPEFEFSPYAPSASELASRAENIAAALTQTSAPAIPFEQIEDLDQMWQRSSANGISFAIGVEGARTVEVTLGDDREQRHNALVTGAVGQGKSNLLKVMVHSLCQRYSPDELELHMLDFKAGVTLFPFASTDGAEDYLPHARVLGLESDREFGVAVLQRLNEELDLRSRVLRPYGDNIASYRAAMPSARMPRIVLVVDEFQVMFDPADSVAETSAQLLESLARRGRACGIHIVLASQTISGIAGLMTRENGIFSQFPIRVALKNSVSESFATLVQGNDGAAKLRARGEAILNLDYGALHANRPVIIAAADGQVTSSMQLTWWKAARESVAPPFVFDGARPMRLGEARHAIGAVTSQVTNDGVAPTALIGFEIGISEMPLGITLSRDPGRNIAVLGAGEKGGRGAPSEKGANVAFGILQSAAVSLALQHPEGDADFVCFDLSDAATARRNHQPEWLDLMQSLGFTVESVAKDDIATRLVSLVERVASPEVQRKVYVIAFGLDRATHLETPDAFAHRPSEDFQKVLRDGPSRGVHVIGWWSNTATFKSQIGFGGDGYVEAMIMLRLDRTSVQEFLGPFVTWSVRDNRGLVSDRTQLEAPTIVVPFSPVTPADAQLLLESERGR